MKHAPIGPTMAVADVRADGTVHIYTHNQNPQALRGEIAQMLGTSIDHIVVHALRRPGPLRTIERRQRGRGRRSGHSVEGRWPAGARAVDARRRFPVVHAVAGGLRRRRNRTGRQRQDDRLSNRPLHARRAGRPAGRRGARRSADDAAPERKGAFGQHRLDRQRHFRSLGLRRRRHSDGTRPRHIPGRPESIAARRRAPRSQHANAGTVPAEFPARTGHQRSGGAGRRRRHPVPHRPRDGRARHRRAQGGPRSVRMGNAPVAACQSGLDRRLRRCAAAASR